MMSDVRTEVEIDQDDGGAARWPVESKKSHVMPVVTTSISLM